MTQQEQLDARAQPPDIVRGTLSGAHQVPHSFIDLIRYPYQRQFVGPKQAGQGYRIPGVVLDALAELDRGVRGGAHMTDEPSRRELSVDHIPAWPCLIDELDRPMLLLEAARQFDDGSRRILDCAKMSNLAAPPSLGDSNRNRVFVDVQADECVDLRHEPFSWKTSPAGSQGLHNWTASAAAKKGHCHLVLAGPVQLGQHRRVPFAPLTDCRDLLGEMGSPAP